MSLPEIKERGALAFVEALEALQAAEIPFLLTSGTALGLYRDNDLIPTDTDLDFLVSGETIGRGNIKRVLEGSRYAVGWDTDHQVVLVNKAHRIICDFQFYRACAEGYSTREPHYLEYSASWIEKPHHITHPRFGRVPLIGSPEKFFERKYGADWRIPKYQQKRVGVDHT